MLERVVSEIRLPLRPEPARWKEQVTEICFEAQRVLTAHRDVSLVSLGSIPVGESQLRITEFLLDLLLQVGLPPQVAAWALDGLGQLIDTDAYEASLYRDRMARGTDPEVYFGELRSYLGSLPPEHFPTLTGMVDTLLTGDGNQRYAFKIEVFLRGLESYLPAARTAADGDSGSGSGSGSGGERDRESAGESDRGSDGRGDGGGWHGPRDAPSDALPGRRRTRS